MVDVVTSGQMFKAVKAAFAQCDCLIMAAAVSDYKPATSSATKIKKDQAEMMLKLKPTKDILNWAGQHKKKDQILVGFALEDKNVLKNAEKKLKDKHLDMIIVNEPAAIGADKSTLHVKTSTEAWITYENISKLISANRILNLLQHLF